MAETQYDDVEYKIEGNNIRSVERMRVARFLNDIRKYFSFEMVVSEGIEKRFITQRDVHRPGLALAGFVKLFTHEKIQILGNTEYYYMNDLTEDVRKQSIRQLFDFDIPLIIATNGNPIFPEMIELCRQRNIPMITTTTATTDAIHLVSSHLDEIFAPEISVHGSMVDVYGIGMMLTGKSGIGKSEIALDLVERGHRLVADDTVRISKISESVLMTRGHDKLKHFMEIRGVGIVDVREMFGIRAVRLQKRLEVQVDLRLWDGKEEYERLGIDETTNMILGIKIPLIKLPVYPGKNITVIAETIALNLLLRAYGYNSAQEFQLRLAKEIQKKNQKGKSFTYFIDRDFE